MLRLWSCALEEFHYYYYYYYYYNYKGLAIDIVVSS